MDLPLSKTKFPRVYLFHGQCGSPNGTVLEIEAVLQSAYYGTKFERPLLPHARPEVTAGQSLDWAVLQYRKEIVPDSLIVGVSMGGLIAARLQELSPNLNLSVITLMAPTWMDDVKLEEKLENRIALYSSLDKSLVGNRDNWTSYARAFDMPMLAHHDLDLCKYATCYLISCFMQGKDMTKEVNQLFPSDEDILKY